MSDTPEQIVVDGTVEEVHEEPHPTPAASVEVARRERRSEVIRPLDAGALVDSFNEYQQLLPRLLSNEDYQDAGRGKRFVKKSGWRKIATAFDLDVQIIRSTVDRGADGTAARAEVWARAIAPSGRSMDGDGYCDVAEERFSGARGNKSKLENDLRATATTRAMNRAISGLVGMGEVSAEEVDASGREASWADAPASGEMKASMVDVLAEAIGDKARAVEFAKQLAARTGGQVPAVIAAWLSALPAWRIVVEADDAGVAEDLLDVDDARAEATA